MKPAIQVRNLGKRYDVGRQYDHKRTLRESIVASVAAPFQRWRNRKRGTASAPTEDFWALRDVEFEVQPGDVVGIIGRNGAGKSTLLKILSRITEPTEGRVEIRGRMASLLEVGTGFHQELTGRENIYLNGALLGMSRKEIATKLDEIVAFSQIEQFLDTPVKRYSSGMYVRLAFAVAAHLEPEILIVDEILAVGDAAFQRKCVGKLGEVSHSGRTVLFVSHNMPVVKSLCKTGVLLKSGKVAAVGPIQRVAEAYLDDGLSTATGTLNRTRRIAESSECRIVDAWMTVNGGKCSDVEWDRPFELDIIIEVAQPICVAPEYLIRDQDQQPVLYAPTGRYQGFTRAVQPGRYRITSKCAGLRLASGSYYVDIMVVETSHRYFDYYECGLTFTVGDLPRPESGWKFRQSRRHGVIPLAVETSVNPC